MPLFMCPLNMNLVLNVMQRNHLCAIILARFLSVFYRDGWLHGPQHVGLTFVRSFCHSGCTRPGSRAGWRVTSDLVPWEDVPSPKGFFTGLAVYNDGKFLKVCWTISFFFVKGTFASPQCDCLPSSWQENHQRRSFRQRRKEGRGPGGS